MTTRYPSDSERIDALLTRLAQYETSSRLMKERIKFLEDELRHERNAACEAARRR